MRACDRDILILVVLGEKLYKEKSKNILIYDIS